MFDWIRFSTLFLTLRARRAGEADGKALIPHAGDQRPPKYLLYLRDIGTWRVSGLQARWQSADGSLYPAYVRGHRLYEQARDRLSEADAAYEVAQARREERGTERNKQALADAAHHRNRMRRRAERAELRLSRAQARRQARWEEFDAAFRALAAETDQYMQIYADANVKHRDLNDLPPGLLEEYRPHLERPPWLEQLGWTVPPLTEQPARTERQSTLPG